MFNSHSRSRLSYSASLKPRVSSTFVWAYISLIRSFFCHEIYQTLRSHYTTMNTLATLILPYKHHVYSFIYQLCHFYIYHTINPEEKPLICIELADRNKLFLFAALETEGCNHNEPVCQKSIEISASFFCNVRKLSRQQRVVIVTNHIVRV